METGGSVSLYEGWDTLWGAISGPLGSFTTLMTAIGVLIIMAAVGKYVWDKRRGSAVGAPVLWAIALGAALAGPDLIIPLVLQIVDIIVNAAVSIFQTGTSGTG